MKRGRPKAQIPREKRLDLRLTNFEFEKISRLAEKLKLSKTDTIIRAINLLETYKPKKYKALTKNPGKNVEGIIEGETIMFNKK